MGSDVIFGQNDSFVLFFVVLAIYLLQRRQVTPSAIVLGLACASKPTAWFLVLFYLLYLVRDAPLSRKSISSQVIPILALVVTFVLLVLPFALWDLAALLDDVWGWSVGTAAIPYQIRGWGLANFVLAFDWVDSRLSYFPFWIPELLVCAPLFVFLAWRQWRENTVGNMLLGYAVLLFAFLYVSRFLNENYLGYILACLAMGCWVDASAVRTTPSTVVQ
jgi:Gpi18-like mannosyltransferase